MVALLAGCGPRGTEIVVRDPFAVSLSSLEGCERTSVLPAEPAPTPSPDPVERAIAEAHTLGSYRAAYLDRAAVPGQPRLVARRYGRGGLSVNYTSGLGARRARTVFSGTVLDDEGLIHIYDSDLPFTRLRIDREAGELVVTIHHHGISMRRSSTGAFMDLELRTPLSNVLQIRTLR